jgi:hypothetical protein
MTLSFYICKSEVDLSDECKRVRKSLTRWSLKLARLPWNRTI